MKKANKLYTLALGALPLLNGCGTEPQKPEPIITIIEDAYQGAITGEEPGINEENIIIYTNKSFDGEITNIADFYGLPVSAAYENGFNIGSAENIVSMSNLEEEVRNTLAAFFAERLRQRLGLENAEEAGLDMVYNLQGRCGLVGAWYDDLTALNYLGIAYLPPGVTGNCLENQNRLTTAQFEGTTGMNGDDGLIEAIRNALRPDSDELPPGFAPYSGGNRQ